ncbi:zinc finger protein castor homolog 1-like isoform X2 [Epargyreus clarus]|uniref:zinc finger protein castor homolog 1-like isoform X2 n=1 Tax=Epargyreus clarus TaxID=520877 RepID=UPI003C2CE2B3
MTTAMAAHQESIHERLQPGPEEPLFLHHGATSWTSDNQEEHSADMSPYYNLPKRNKRKNFKPRCAPNATTFSDESNGAHCETDSPVNGNDRTTPDQAEDETDEANYSKIGVKNFSLLKGGAVDLSRRLSTDSNENIDSNYQNRLPDEKKVDSFQRSYIHSLQMTQDPDRERTVLNFSSLQNKSFCAKNPFAISQLIKTNSPPRRRDSDSDEENKGQDINANERLEGQDGMDTNETQQNGDASNATNKILRDYAMNTMKELLGIYGLSSNEVADAITGQIRALEALQGKPFTQIPLSLKRRHDSGDGTEKCLRRSSSATEDEGSTNITPPKTPDNDLDTQRQRALQIINQQSMRLFGRQSQDEDGSGSEDGDQTLDLSVSRDTDGQEQSTTSSAGNSVSEFEQQSILMRKNLEDLANLQMQGFFQKQSMMDTEDSQERKLHASGLLSALNHLDQARKNSMQTTVDYSRYVKRYSSTLECGSSYCKDLGYREHFHCMDCTARVFCKKEEMIRHFKWHKKRDESLAHGFMRYSPLDDCSERFTECPHNRSQTHYHCIQDGCDKVYISTSDVQMHANYHRKDSAILQEGFQRFRATESCAAPHCVFAGQRTTHFHCRRPGCTYTFKNKADMEKHKTYHIKDEALSKDGFKKYMKNEACPYRDCRFSRTCNHIHCIRPHCNYVLHSSSQIFTHKRKHERKEQEMSFGLPTSVIQSALMQQGADLTLYSPGSNLHGDDDMSSSMFDTDFSHPFNPALVEEASRKYIETFNGCKEAEDKCTKCSALNKHYHCLAEGCKMAHSCHNTMVKHVMEHEQQNQVTDAYFVTYTRHNPCSNSACQHIRDITHYHCTWENCGAVILSSEEHPFRRLEHHRQHAILSPMSPNLAARFAPNFNPQLSAQLHPNMAAQLGQVSNMPNLPHNLAQLAQMTPSLSSQLTPNLQAQLNLGPSPGIVPQQVNPSSSLDEMFSRKRGRPPKNRVVEVWTDNVTPQAIFTSFKLPKSNQMPPVIQSPVIATVEEFPRIKFQHFEVFTTPDACSQYYPHCQLRMTRLHLHCFNCSFTGETHHIMETHMRESHSICPLLEGFDYFSSYDQCGGKSCFKNQLRSHFHCAQGNNCPAILTQYSAVATHKHGRGTPVIKSEVEQEKQFEEAKDYSIKERASVDSIGSAKEPSEYAPTNFSIKSEFEREQDNVSVKATGTFYPSSHLRSNTSSPSPRSIYDASPSKEMKMRMEYDQKKTYEPKPSGPTIPPSCHDQTCPLNKNAGGMNLHYHCPHCSQAYVDLKLLFSHMVKKHSNAMEPGPVGLQATKETLEREYPEISILPSTASSSSAPQAPSPSQRPPNPAEQVQAVHSLLLQQYLAGGRKGSLQDQLKMQQQYTASLAGLPGLAQVALFSQGGSPFPLYPTMLYPPELLLEQSLLQSHGLPPGLDKEAEMIAKSRRTHSARGPHMRVLKDEPIPEGYLRFRFNEDCAYQHCGYREHQTHFHCTRKDCGYSFCDKTRFVQHTARHERLDTLMGGDFQQYRANVYCQRAECPHASTFGTGQNKASHFHCLKCDFVCTDTNKVVAHRRQHQKLDSIQAAGFEKFPPSKGCGYEPQCIHSKKQTHYHCLQCGFAVLGLSQMTSHKYKHQEVGLGPSTSATN